MSRPRRVKTSFGGDVLKLVSGTAVAQALLILAAPVLTRLYAPEDFGAFALFVSVSFVISLTACLRYELAIMLPDTDEEAANLLGLSVLIVLLSTIATTLLVWRFRVPVSQWLNAPTLAVHLWFLPPAVLAAGVFLALSYWSSRARRFGRLSMAKVAQSSTVVGGQICGGYAGLGHGGTLIGMHVAAQAVAACVLGGQIWRDDRAVLRSSIGWRRMLSAARRYAKFPLLSSGSALMNALSLQLPALLLAMFFPASTVGFYALGHRLLSTPMSLVGNAIGQVFFQRASAAQTDASVAPLVAQTVVRLMAVGVFPFLLIMLTGQDLFAVVFGQPWAEAGLYAQILAPWVLLVFISAPVSTLYVVLERQEIGLLFDFALAASRGASLVIGGLAGSVLLALVLFSASGTLLWVLLCGYLVSKAGAPIGILLRAFLRHIALAVALAGPVILCKWVFGASPSAVVIVALLLIVLHAWHVVTQIGGFRGVAGLISGGRE